MPWQSPIIGRARIRCQLMWIGCRGDRELEDRGCIAGRVNLSVSLGVWVGNGLGSGSPAVRSCVLRGSWSRWS